MSDFLTGDDPLFHELYDADREAQLMGSLVEADVNPRIDALLAGGPVQKGFVRELLDLQPYHRHVLVEGRPGYTALSYEACETALRDSTRYSSTIVHQPNTANEEAMSIIEMDGARHLAYRRALQPKFIEPEAVTWWRRRWVDDIVAQLVDRLRGKGRAELNHDLFARIPVYTITRAIGLEGEDALEFRSAYFKASGVGASSVEEQRACYAKAEHMLLDLIRRRRAAPDDDLASQLVAATLALPDGEIRGLTDREAMHYAKLVLIAGGGSTQRQMGIMTWALLTHPDQFRDLRQDRTLMKRVVDEAIRWNTTATLFDRLVLEDTVLCGVELPAGSVLEICLGAANRDPARWERPEVFDIHRAAKPHLGFGIGQHRCLGMSVAHAEIAGVMNALMDAFPSMRFDPAAPAPFMSGGLEQRAISALPVLLT